MAQFPVNPQAPDPYKNFKFRLKWDGKYVAGGSKMTALKRTTEVVEHRAGGDPSTSHKSPGRNKFEAITLERGLTQDMAFHDWAGLVWNFGVGAGSEVSLANFRKDIYLEFYNEAGQLVIAYKIYRCWVSEYQAHARSRCQCQCHRHRAHQDRERRLGARYQRDRAAGAHAQRPSAPNVMMRTLSNSDFLRFVGARLRPASAGSGPAGLGRGASRNPCDSAGGLAPRPPQRALWRSCAACSAPRLQGWTACPAVRRKARIRIGRRNSLADRDVPATRTGRSCRGTRFGFPPAAIWPGSPRDRSATAAAAHTRSCCARPDRCGRMWSDEDMEEVGEQMALADPMAEIAPASALQRLRQRMGGVARHRQFSLDRN